MILAQGTGKDNPKGGAKKMREVPHYPENRLDIRIDEQGNVSYAQNPMFAKYYAPSREEKEEELEELRDRLELLEIDEPPEDFSDEHDDWEEERRDLEDQIEALEEEIADME